jgi:alginate O-acetyltransferase complex protein AlgI
MNFNTLGFLGFFLAVLLAVHGIRRDDRRQWLILLASYLFYASWDLRFVPLLALVSAVSYVGGMAVAAGRRSLLTPVILLLLLPLAFFKYVNFLLGAALDLAGALGFGAATPTMDVVLPIGVSFFTFQAISYVCDVAWNRAPVETSARRYFTYMAFFPHLVAGPIVRGADFLPQMRQAWQQPAAEVMAASLARFFWGMFKKVCIADHLSASVVDPVFANLDHVQGGTIVVAVFAFGLQIYADFSGYSDMAISAARLLGFRLKENFDAPYLASSIRDFWRRWHMSLSLLIRDYVYFPLGGSRDVSRPRAAFNALAAMTLCGLWHGAAWTFILWGTLHGLGLMAERLLSAIIPRLPGRAALGWLVSHAFVMVAWALFRVGSLDELADAVARVATTSLKPTDLSPAFLGLVLADAAILYGEQAWVRFGGVRLRVGWNTAAATALATATLVLQNPRMGAKAFIYFQF